MLGICAGRAEAELMMHARQARVGRQERGCWLAAAAPPRAPPLAPLLLALLRGAAVAVTHDGAATTNKTTPLR